MAKKTKPSAKKITKKVTSKKTAKPILAAVESVEVPEKVVSAPEPVELRSNEAKPYAANRDRRMNPEGRRGRFSEKTPPGTRTKMIKIIYDRKAELQEQRRKLLIIKLTFAAIIIGCIYYGSISIANFTSRTTQNVIEALEVDHWWDTVAKPNSKTKTTKKVYKTPTRKRSKSNKYTIKNKSKKSRRAVLKSAKKTRNRRSYKKNRN